MIDTNKRKRINSGFSMVELIITITIMVILAGVIAPALIRYLEKSRRGNDLNSSSEIQKAFERALADSSINIDLGNGTKTVILDSSSNYNNPPQNISDAIAIELGGIPASSTNKDYLWYIVYDATDGKVIEIHLTDESGTAPLYELYPDNSDFID